MSTASPTMTLAQYEEAAHAYLESLTIEHFMESQDQGTQRKITLESLDLVTARRPEVKVFNDILIQYQHGRPPRLCQVVPDNFVVLHEGDLTLGTRLALNLPYHDGVHPFWCLEYVSKSNRRKDYEINLHRYERELRVPYYLLFEPEIQEMNLFRRGARKYVSVSANSRGRFEIPELSLEVAIHERWVRFWYEGELIPLPGDLLRSLEATQIELENERRLLLEERQRTQALEAELAALRAQMKPKP